MEAARCFNCGAPMIERTVADPGSIMRGSLLCDECKKKVKGLPPKRYRPPLRRAPRKSYRG